MLPRSFYSLLGFCQAAGKVCSGYNTCEANMNKGNAYLVVIADDAAPNTKEFFEGLALRKKVPVIRGGASELLARAIGKPKRVVLCILDQQFAASLLNAAGEAGKC
ncbi:MAG: ribosomal L7Ae/L30e/S12e/Gadd45 family protein [Limnochordia bacterium]|nr:ribosomal L7Ae/L30e/S12e/Gadd45 family protein [Limnochordia bacterium]